MTLEAPSFPCPLDDSSTAFVGVTVFSFRTAPLPLFRSSLSVKTLAGHGSAHRKSSIRLACRRWRLGCPLTRFSLLPVFLLPMKDPL